MKRKTTKAGLDIIKKWETLRLKPYWDNYAKQWVIGYGHTRTAASNMPAITKAQADEMLKGDVYISEMYVQANFPKLRQCQFDAVVSLIYNIKIKNFKKTKLYKLLKENPDSKHVSGEWIEFRNSGGVYLRGLLRRRLDELNLYYPW